MTEEERNALQAVHEAATSEYRRLLTEAGKYEKLRMPKIVQEYERDYLKPLRSALKTVDAFLKENTR